MKAIKKALLAELSARGLDAPPALVTAYCEAAVAAREAAKHMRRAGRVVDGRPSPWWSIFTDAVSAMRGVRKTLGLERNERHYVGVRNAREAAARMLPADSVFAPLSPPPFALGRRPTDGKPN
jgi:phage terminase small subunit